MDAIPGSLLARAVEHFRAGRTCIEALRAARDEEEAMICKLLNARPGSPWRERLDLLRDTMCRDVYHAIRRQEGLE